MNLERPVPLNPKGYILDKFIAEGGFSEVWLGRHEESNTQVAIKVFYKRTMDSKIKLNDFKNEVHIHKQLLHPFLVRFYETLENCFYYYIIMEFLPGKTLKQMIVDKSSIEDNTLRTWAVQFLMAIDYLHTIPQVCHMDLKASNLIVDSDNNIRLIDFGISRPITNNTVQNDKQGTLYYFAPERFNEETVTTKVDIWSFGVILYYMFSKTLPFSGESPAETAQLIKNSEPCYLDEIPQDITDLIKSCLIKDPVSRISMEQIKKIHWVSEIYSEMQGKCGDMGALNSTNQKFISILRVLEQDSSCSNPGSIRLRKRSTAMRRISSSGRFKVIDYKLANFGSSPNFFNNSPEEEQ